MTLRRTALAAVLALTGLAATADRASAQYYTSSYGVTPYGGYYNTYASPSTYSYGYVPPYSGVGVYSYPAYSTYSLYPNYVPGAVGAPLFYGNGWIGRFPNTPGWGWGRWSRW